MGSCAGKSQRLRNVQGLAKKENGQFSQKGQSSNKSISANHENITKNEEQKINQNVGDQLNNQVQASNKEIVNQQNESQVQEDKTIDVTQKQDPLQGDGQKMLNHIENQEDEEEKTEAVKAKNTIHNLDQQSTYFTTHLNELTSKKDCQSSETSTNMRPKKPTKVNTYDVGIVVQIFEPTQNSMDDVFSINEVDEEVEEDSQENLTDENEENIAQKNQHFQNLKDDKNQFIIFNTIQQRNPNDVLSSLSNSKLSHSDIQEEHLE